MYSIVYIKCHFTQEPSIDRRSIRLGFYNDKVVILILSDVLQANWQIF